MTDGKDGKNNSMLSKNKKKLLLIIAVGTIVTVFIFIFYLSRGQYGNYSLVETFSALWHYIQDPSSRDNPLATIIGLERLPRALATLLVGIGLSLSGAMYQATIRNPLVDPYIMGVSAGAGAAAIAVIAFNFTFFGLLSSVSLYAVPIAAMMGGVAAFFVTMLLAEKAGGSAVNYILAGVIVGLALSAVQTLLLQTAGDELPKAMAWLFGSFKNVSWDEVWVMILPILVMSIYPLINARKFNLMLLGEDQAKQMGLDARKFSRYSLIIASLLASISVAFVGIIGFVGLVVPHICRMILGGDHRFVLPASIFFGGSLMMLADLVAKTLVYSSELPVGALTTLIGVPVFMYLLVRKGRMYDG